MRSLPVSLTTTIFRELRIQRLLKSERLRFGTFHASIENKELSLRHCKMADWDIAYDIRAEVRDAQAYLDRWQGEASIFRDAMSSRLSCELSCTYGRNPRNKYDLFLPEKEAEGLVIFIHGGYWRALDKSYFSHLAMGPLAHGWKVAMPSYTLAPEARIGDITKEIAGAISVMAESHPGPIRLIGHSAGGHLVSRMLCSDGLLSDDVYGRIVNTVAVSGLFDLQHFPKTNLNTVLHLDEAEVKRESPADHMPRENAIITCLVGTDELPELIRQNEVLEIWKSSGAEVKVISDQGKNHFSVIEPLANPSSLLTSALLN